MNASSLPVEFREITLETVRKICALSETLSPVQRTHVADNAVSIAEAHFAGDHAWFRAICVGNEPVGFIMTYTEPDEVFLWRFMIAGPHQGKGYGRQALGLLFDRLRGQAVKELVTSCVPGDDGPQDFYERLGFAATDKMVGDERVMVVQL